MIDCLTVLLLGAFGWLVAILFLSVFFYILLSVRDALRGQ